jgi:phage terminase small subunit
MGKRGPKSFAEQALILPIQRAKVHDSVVIASDPTQPPGHLSADTKTWWLAVIAENDLEPHQLRTLQCAGEAWDRYQQARQGLATGGLTFADDKGMIRSRPEISIERDSRIAFVRCMRELNLKTGPPPSSGLQPPSLFR